MCSGWATFVARRDERDEIELVPMQSPEGRALLEEHGYSPDAMSTIVYVEEGRVLTKSRAVLGILNRLAWPWPILAFPAELVPTAVRDALYDVIARNRRRLFGAQTCEWEPPAKRG